jgi:hypothetical protein
MANLFSKHNLNKNRCVTILQVPHRYTSHYITYGDKNAEKLQAGIQIIEPGQSLYVVYTKLII